MIKTKSQITIFHNPRCSKSRQTLNLLKEQGVEPEIFEYLKTPPDKGKLNEILNLLNLQPRDLMRKKEKVYQEQALSNLELSRDQLLEAMIQYPILIERPIVLAKGKAALGRPPENALKIL
ncbi:MAG: arsenate reductase (glutaredoxin) [Pseudomonadota bacterium]